MERFSVLWKEETFYDETIEMITAIQHVVKLYCLVMGIKATLFEGLWISLTM